MHNNDTGSLISALQAIAASISMQASNAVQQEQLGLAYPNTSALAPISIFAEAESIISGDREQVYGRADDNLQTIAGVWNGLLAKFARDAACDIPNDLLCAADVAIMMAAMKLARLAHSPAHRDSQVDTMGYIGLLNRITAGSSGSSGR